MGNADKAIKYAFMSALCSGLGAGMAIAVIIIKVVGC